ncbi:cation-transporting P-type ATPase [Rahnella sp. Lac-M11]|jgi:magnesium-transporting ATPase (P-type)|uniref:Cation-transporting P-type ATPase n=1 Tax=Rahnella contaminans TaxID=2703882 RepID=A0A6M2B4L1_9GAMM|nr:MULTISPECIES: cation-transporting P-type ATPase [Rahnella]MCS3424036.1 magnesium-transporting ATPase (P-type) [Rahnella sp. BIGb0603]NGX87461.1 cation-transporting P-type ATPase [Rahnella contaminans]
MTHSSSVKTNASPSSSAAAENKNWYQISSNDAMSRLETSEAGLNPQVAAERLKEFGPNALPEKPTKSALMRFLAHFNDVLIYILLAAAVVTGAMGHWVDTLVILGVAVINAMIGFLQENSAEKSLKSIQNMLSSQAVVIRDGQIQTINADQLVPGDIVQLRPGDKIPADLRIVSAHNLQVEEAILTGESTVVTKTARTIDDEVMIGDRHNLLFSGTMISGGTATGVVYATGKDTELGHINQMMSSIEPQRTPLLQQIDKLGKGIFALILLMMAFLFVFAFILRDMPLGELLLSLISLAVASVPEGLPAIISIILSLGVQSMARNHAIIRKLPTVETLGSMTVICSDKTGTLTMNEMTVKAVILADRAYNVEGESYQPRGRIVDATTQQQIDVINTPVLNTFITAVDLCNDSQLIQDDKGHWGITGGPTSGALKVLAAKCTLNTGKIESLDKIPFDSKHKYMSTLQRIDGKTQLFVTGAPDVLFSLATFELTENGVQPFRREYWEEEMARYARQGLRMVAAAFRDEPEINGDLSHDDLQQGLVFAGIAGMMDPPRPEAIDAIAQCQQAGIRVKMITGDHQETAMAIGKMLGIGNSGDSITGNELEHMDDAELAVAASQYDIFARTSPEHKLRLVKALQENGEVVGMTGDGVNDAPALKQADVGIAMGIKGTEVTKEAADMVLTDDNFATIASAVKEGRRVYDNLKKTILFILPTNLAQGLLIILAILAGAVIPLTPVQILWMNMATSTTLSFGLAFEPAEKGMMRRRPREPGQHVLDLHAVWRIAFVGILIACSAFILEAWMQPLGYSSDLIRTVLLQTLVTAQWVYMFNCRVMDRFPLSREVFVNKGLWIVSGVLLVLQLALIYLPVMNHLFGTVPLPLKFWGITLLVGAMIFVIVEIEKWLVNRFIRKKA